MKEETLLANEAVFLSACERQCQIDGAGIHRTSVRRLAKMAGPKWQGLVEQIDRGDLPDVILVKSGIIELVVDARAAWHRKNRS